MGSRLLRRWIQRPLRDAETLKGRYQAVEAIVADHLAGLPDLWKSLLTSPPP